MPSVQPIGKGKLNNLTEQMGDSVRVRLQHPDEAHLDSRDDPGNTAREVQQLRQQLDAAQAAHRAAEGMVAAQQRTLHVSLMLC